MMLLLTMMIKAASAATLRQLRGPAPRQLRSELRTV